MIDTLKANEELLAAKFTPEQAKAIVHVHSTSADDLVTKDYLDIKLSAIDIKLDAIDQKFEHRLEAMLAPIRVQMRYMMAGIAAILLLLAKEVFLKGLL